LLERQGTLEVKKAADDLLPSTSLIVGYELEGEDWGSNNADNKLFAGVSISVPIGRSTSKARHEITKIQYQKTVLANQNIYEDLHTNLKNLHLQIQREQKLMEISKEKIRLSNAILKDETENYSFGKVSLNDYIDAVNTADENRFSFTAHQVLLNKLIAEWLRLTDKLVDENAVLKVSD
jgi:outer membrane protein TolC